MEQRQTAASRQKGASETKEEKQKKQNDKNINIRLSKYI